MAAHAKMDPEDDSEIPFLITAREAVLSHHEKGGGPEYPFGFAGEAIAERDLVVAVVGVYDPLVSHRVYRCAPSEEEAL